MSNVNRTELSSSELSLSDIICTISEGGYVIPKFQRNFTWKPLNVAELGDSILRRYPISTLLLMSANGSLDIAYDPLKTHNSFVGDIDLTYVLDGQQRLTSIAKLFLSMDDKREYYFDLLAILIEEFPLDNIVENYPFLCGKRTKGKIMTYPNETCRSFQISSTNKDIQPTRQNYRMISCALVASGKFVTTINKYLRNQTGMDSDISDKYTDYLSFLLSSVKDYRVPSTSIGKDSELGVVCRVFEKINSTGINLNTFDLINAKSYIKYKNGLGQFLMSGLKEINCESSNYFFEVKDDGVPNFGRISRVIFLAEQIATFRGSRLPLITNSAMLETDVDIWFEGWKKIKENISRFLVLMDKKGVLRSCSKSFLEYMLSVCVAIPSSIDNHRFIDNICDYAYSLQIIDSSFNKSNIHTVMDFIKLAYALEKGPSFSFDYDFVSPPAISFDKKKILEMNTAYKSRPVINLLYLKGKMNKFSIDICGKDIDLSSEFDIHHIFPKSKAIYESKHWDSVANKCILSSSDNRNLIKDMDFCSYVNKMIESSSNEYVSFRLEQNLLRLSDISLTTDEAINKRADRIADHITSYFSKYKV